MLFRIPANGYATWSDSLAKVLNRFAAVWVAEDAGGLVGFTACRVRAIPPYFGGMMVGLISEVYVRQAYRGLGLARRMLDAARLSGMLTVWVGWESISEAGLQAYSSDRKVGEDRERAVKTLKDHGVPLHPSSMRRHSMACPAVPTCGLAISEAERALPGIIDRFEVELKRLGLQSENIGIRMTGCPNGCVRPYQSDIGVVGRSAGQAIDLSHFSHVPLPVATRRTPQVRNASGKFGKCSWA